MPLRLLAREVYDKCVDKVGVEKVALITGEEKITPKDPHYILATVEAMPLDRKFDFLAIDSQIMIVVEVLPSLEFLLKTAVVSSAARVRSKSASITE